jgi:hypothetical protein
MGVSSQLYAPAALPHEETASGTHWIGGWVGPTGGVATEQQKKKSLGF